jgi:DNA-binding MarR family transcriptional regulator
MMAGQEPTSQPQTLKQIPPQLEQYIIKLTERINNLKKQYKTLANWGRPYLYSVQEVAVIYYLNAKLGIGLNQLALRLGVDKTSLYKMLQRLETEKRVAIYNEQTKKVDVIEVSPEELVNIVESEILQVASKQRITDPFKSSIIMEFWTRDIERMTNVPGRRSFYSEDEKRETIKVVEEIMNYLAQKDQPSNPDFWTRELLLKTLEELYPDPRTRRNKIKLLRRVPQFRDWLKGKVGAERRYITPKLSAIYYGDYLRLKELWRRGEVDDATMLVIWLHITTGAREGWGSEITSESMDLDEAKTSLIGLKWENLSGTVIRIYEHKTMKEWTADLTWLDAELVPVLLKYKKRERGSILKDITGCKTVKEFKEWYSKQLKRISKLLGLQFTLVPHDMRRSHISILAELGVPLEMALSGSMDFGVGWEDVTTALIFYLRFSKYTKQKLYESMNARKAEIAQLTSKH